MLNTVAFMWIDWICEQPHNFPFTVLVMSAEEVDNFYNDVT